MTRAAWLVAAAALTACASHDVKPVQSRRFDAPPTVAVANPSGGDRKLPPSYVGNRPPVNVVSRPPSSDGNRPSLPVLPKPTVRDDYAHWQRLDDQATAEYTAANACRLLAVAVGDHAAVGAANQRHDAAFDRHLLYSASANLAWNREHGVRGGAK